MDWGGWGGRGVTTSTTIVDRMTHELCSKRGNCFVFFYSGYTTSYYGQPAMSKMPFENYFVGEELDD